MIQTEIAVSCQMDEATGRMQVQVVYDQDQAKPCFALKILEVAVESVRGQGLAAEIRGGPGIVLAPGPLPNNGVQGR